MKHPYVKLLLSVVTAALLLAIPLIALRIERSYMRKLGDAGLESKKHSDGGYVADKAVLAFFEEKEYLYTGGRYDNQAIRYRLHRPSNIDPQRTYPLIVWLHGKGESGDENTRQLSHVQTSIEFFDGENELDFFMLATQCPKDNPDWNTSISPEGKGDAPLTILE